MKLYNNNFKVMLEYIDNSKRIASFIDNKYYVYLTNYELNLDNVKSIIHL